MTSVEPILRLATVHELDRFDALMKSSTHAIFPTFYDQVQTDSSVRYVAAVDKTLVEDGTYFVVEADRELIACGGWSRRGKLYSGSAEGIDDDAMLDPAWQPAHVRAMFVRGDWTRRGIGTLVLDACEAAARAEGFQKLDLMATLPGLPLYERYGFRVVEPVDIPLADGINIAGAAMEKPII